MAKILIVEDDKDIVLLLDMYLTMKGHTIIEKAYDGEMGIHCFKNNYQQIDFVLMDYRMPIKNGMEAAKEILAFKPNNQIIFLTADYTIQSKAEKLGVVGFIIKPISFNVLNNLIERTFRKTKVKENVMTIS